MQGIPTVREHDSPGSPDSLANATLNVDETVALAERAVADL